MYDRSLNFVSVTPISPPALGQKVIFTPPTGPLSGTAPVGSTDLQVSTDGVYEISMDLTARLINVTNVSVNTEVQFALFINDTTQVLESTFESYNRVSGGTGGNPVTLEIRNSIGKTIQRRLNANDRLSIRVVFASQNVSYRLPSLVVTKIAN
ncbi:hypothetical protein [Bacillus sp. 37MA]|uniref:hypothetical protein n=1 Tax=Bacillus sp. 37MA TaxID=1132442 RepID=UPI0012DC8388|nr:hypothetical protein [Bacillus sp. 37MA]